MVVPMHGETDMNIPTDGKPWRPLIPLEEAAYLLGGITEREIYKRIEAGDLERVKLGRRSFVTRVSIDAFIERLREEAAQRRNDAA